MKKFAILAALLAVTPVVAQASVTINMANAYWYTHDGVTSQLPTGSTITLIADADGDGFGDLTQATDTWLGDADDVLMARWGSNGWVVWGEDGNSWDSHQVPFAGLAAGDPILMVWYELPYDGGATGPGEGVYFGSYGDWLVPADGATVQYNFQTVAAGGQIPDCEGVADQMTVPEPASLALMLLGGGLLAARRRR